MGTFLRRAAIRVLIPLSWRISRQRIAKSLNRFSHTEADSAWQMLQALQAVEDPSFSVELFNNALEEVHHAALFAKLANDYTSAPLPYASDRRQQLFDPKTGIIAFEACHFVGELDVYEQFLSYSTATGEEKIRQEFLAIRGDEEEHQKLAYAQLIKLVGEERKVKRMIRKVRLSRAYDAWIRFAKGIGNVMNSILLWTIYLLAAPFYTIACSRRLAATRAPVAVVGK